MSEATRPRASTASRRSCGSRQQLEYYFSIGDLCKGVFPRTQMGAGGFVDLATLSRFGLIAALAADAAELANAARQPEAT